MTASTTPRFPRPPRSARSRHLLTAVLTASVAAALLPAVGTPASAAPDWTSLNTSFVQRDGDRLELDGETFRFSGPNIYWLGLDENVGGVDYPTAFRIADTLDSAARMGSTVVRTHMMTSTGQSGENPLAIMPALGEVNEEAFATIDFAIAYAGSLGIRLVLPLTDEWEYYHGGHRDFTTPLGLESADFYIDARAIEAYQDYVGAILDRTNALTGVRYVEDPTILAWELGNELEGMTLPWIDQQVAFIKERAPEQLVAAGRRFDIDPDTLAAPGLDIVDVHYYPPTAARVAADAATVVAAGKVYMAGEYASTAASPALLDPLVDDPNVSGMLFWSLFGNDDRGGLVPHDDGFTVHAPGVSDGERDRVAAITAYAASVDGTARQPVSDPPLITTVDRVNGINTVSWRGAGGASGYRVERSVGGGAWSVVETGALRADAGSATDFESPADARYRVIPVLPSGDDGVASDPVTVFPDSAVLVDPLESWLLTDSHENARISPRLDRTSVVAASGRASVVWERDGLSRAEFLVSGEVDVEMSEDGVSWSPATTSANPAGTIVATDLVGPFVRVSWTGDAAVSRATIWSTVAGPAGPPSAFALRSPAAGTADVTATPAFAWDAADGAAYYRFTLATDVDLAGVVAVVTGLRDTTVKPEVSLEPGARYWWSVEAINGAGATLGAGGPSDFLMKALPTEGLSVEDFESYDDDAALQAAYVRNAGGGAISPIIVSNPDTRTQAMEASYDLAGPGYAGIVRTFTEPQDWWGYAGLAFWLQAVPGDDVTVQFVANGTYWETIAPVDGDGWQRVVIPFSDFAPPAWAGEAVFDPTSVTQLAFYLGGEGSGALLVDDVVTIAAEAAEPGPSPSPSPDPSDPAPADPDSDGDPDDGLAVTGATPAAWVFLAGSLVLGGLAAMFLVRRRRS